VHGHAARVIASVLQALQALHEDGNDVAGRNGADDATHRNTPGNLHNRHHGRHAEKKFQNNILKNFLIYFMKPYI
jgi:hypothetical protein